MYYEDNKAKDVKICYIGGGSRGWAWTLFNDLAKEPAINGEICLYDIDLKAAKDNEVIGSKIMALPECKSRWSFSVAETLEEGLKGSDIVVVSILPGTFTQMRSDVHLPERLGIYQSVGDTVGLGGFVRAMRTLPMFRTIALAVKEVCPDAWVINYTNPMTLCVRALYEAFPGIKAFGCCHEVFGTQELLCKLLKSERGIEGVKRQDIRTNVMGINHFTWFESASYGGMDLFPLIREAVDKYHDCGYDDGRGRDLSKDPMICLHKVKFDLCRRYGLFAAAGDRHLAEFVPNIYLQSPECANSYGFSLTNVDWREAKQARRIARSKALYSGEEIYELNESGEEGVVLIKAVLGLGDCISNVNLPNVGQISNLPMGSVVETNALFSRDSVKPVFAGALPNELNGIIKRHVRNQEDTLKCAFTCNRTLAYRTFMDDPQFKGTTEEGKKLLDDMLNNTRDYLPKEWF